MCNFLKIWNWKKIQGGSYWASLLVCPSRPDPLTDQSTRIALEWSFRPMVLIFDQMGHMGLTSRFIPKCVHTLDFGEHAVICIFLQIWWLTSRQIWWWKLRDFKPRLKMQSEDVLGFFFWSWKSTVSARWVQLIFASKRSAYQHYPYFIGYLKASIKVLERVLTTTPCK